MKSAPAKALEKKIQLTVSEERVVATSPVKSSAGQVTGETNRAY